MDEEETDKENVCVWGGVGESFMPAKVALHPNGVDCRLRTFDTMTQHDEMVRQAALIESSVFH